MLHKECNCNNNDFSCQVPSSERSSALFLLSYTTRAPVLLRLIVTTQFQCPQRVACNKHLVNTSSFKLRLHKLLRGPRHKPPLSNSSCSSSCSWVLLRSWHRHKEYHGHGGASAGEPQVSESFKAKRLYLLPCRGFTACRSPKKKARENATFREFSCGCPVASHFRMIIREYVRRL